MKTKTILRLMVVVGAPLFATAPAPAQEDDLCLACHAETSVFEEMEDGARLVVTEAQHLKSLHGESGVTCVDCHVDLLEVEDFPHAERLEPADCSMCHGDVDEVFAGSVHGYAWQRGNPRAPTCATCHGNHDIRSGADAASPTHRKRLAETCAGCHGAAGMLTEQLVKIPTTFGSYAQSVHGRSVAEGNGAAATCSDCHGVHDLLGHADPQSRINPANVSSTCGVCHEQVREDFERSIHGMALKAGIADSPTCNDCHGEHMILSPRDPDSKTYARRLATETCGACHADPDIVAKYRLKDVVVGSYVDSYHGWATRREYASAATCVSCHTAHQVLPAAHPESTIHADNVLRTCQSCHETADASFAASYSHEAASITANPVNRWIRNIYWVLITVVVGGMIVHNLVILSFHLVRKRRAMSLDPSMLRFDLAQVIQHMVLAGSFIMLTVTGFALRYPDAWWVRYLAAAGMNEPVRANLHRVFAVILVVAGIGHVAWVASSRRGRSELRAILPRGSDMREALDNLRYHLWRRDEPVAFGRYDYTQKLEYWALIWGTLLMALTGFVLWWPETAVKIFPSWIVAAAQTVHYYEAWLATLAIVFWHLFFVIFHPEEYPMSWTWLTGKISAKTVAKHHAAWYEEETRGRSARRPDKHAV